MVDVTKPHQFVLYDERLNKFINTIDLDNAIKSLGGVIEDFRVTYPQADIVLNWPPDSFVLPLGREISDLRIVYRVLSELLDMSGYPITILQRMSVINHEPRKTTVLQLSPEAKRLVRVH